MAKRKTEPKEAAHPKDREGEQRRGHSFIAPDRRDQIDLTGDERPEVIEVFKGKAPEKVDVHGGDDSAADDARHMATEDDDGGEPDRVQTGGLKRPVRAKTNGEDDEDASYSRRVQARINRERALRLKGDAQLREERAINAKNAERLAKLERGQFDIAQSSGVKDLEAKIKTTTEKLAAAVEEGDTKAQMALTIELGDLQGDLKLLKYDLDQKRKTREREDADAATRQTTTEVVPDKDRTEAFITSNGHWWAKRAYTGVRAECIELDKDILSDIKKGTFDAEPYSDEHFEELAARLAAKYPDLEINSPDGETYEFADEGAEKPKVNDRNERPARGPMGGLGGRNGRRDSSPLTLAKQGKVHLAEQDYAQMRVYGLDPDNDEHKKRFAKERMRTILTDERRGEAR